MHIVLIRGVKVDKKTRQTILNILAILGIVLGLIGISLLLYKIISGF